MARARRRWGGSTPTTPPLSVWGYYGVQSPQSSLTSSRVTRGRGGKLGKIWHYIPALQRCKQLNVNSTSTQQIFKRRWSNRIYNQQNKRLSNSLETTQTSKLYYSNVSYVAEHPLDQFQIDIVYMNKSWFNHNDKYLLTCLDVFSKKADVIPLKDREQSTVATTFNKMLSTIGIPKTIYSDQGMFWFVGHCCGCHSLSIQYHGRSS
jgi:hypothetical protein